MQLTLRLCRFNLNTLPLLKLTATGVAHLYGAEVNMRLKAFQVTNYKTVLDSGRVEIDSNVACLLGKNEAGKSAVMQALWKFNNVSGVNYDRLFDLPAEFYTRLRTADPKVVVLEFELDEQDKNDFLKEFPALSNAPSRVKIHSTYDRKRTVEVTLAYTPSSYGEIGTRVKGTIGALTTLETSASQPATELALVTAARQALEELDNAGGPDKPATEIPTAAIQTATTSLQAVPPAKIGDLGKGTIEALVKFASHSQPDLKKKAEDWLITRLPIFIYFEDYGRLKTRIHLPDFIAKQASAPKDQEEQMLHRTQVALFEWSHLDAEELRKLGQPKQANESQEAVDRRKAERSRILESASYQLSGDWIDWWDQRTHNLKVTADGDELELKVSDNVNPWEIAFGERSRGFQWFFSFYLTFLVESGKAHKGAIILLDEPGLHLHPTAQEKLLDFFQRISAKNQIIYSSHSMFMVDSEHVDNIRTVYLLAKNPDDPKSRAYTHVSAGSEPEGDRDTLLPMQAAGAYKLAQTMFLGKRTLIVEGISDYWLLKALSHLLKGKGEEGLQGDTVVLWAGGTSHMLPLASVMSAREQMGPNRMAVLLDSDRVGLDKARKLVEMMAHGQDSVMLLGDAIGILKAQAEDLVEFDELLAGLKQVGRTPTTIPSRHAGETNVELLKRTFVANTWGELEHEEKARIVLELTDSWWKATSSPKESTLERARKLFTYVNERFTKLGATEASPAKVGK
jgi:predicted ATP-dependent endonuclease of OLD family